MNMLPGDFKFTIQKKFKLDKLAFDAWLLEGGTLEKARQILANKGIINRRRNEPYTKMGVQQAAWRYTVENHEEARPIMENIWKDYGVTNLTDEIWEEYIVNLAMTILGNSSKKRFMDWIGKNPKFEKYEYMYAIRFGIEADRQTQNE